MRGTTHPPTGDSPVRKEIDRLHWFCDKDGTDPSVQAARERDLR